MQRTEPTRNLLILEEPSCQDPADWIGVKERIERDAPDIEVRIANVMQRNSVTARWQVRRPSLVFSPLYLFSYVPRGGAVFSGQFLGKHEQMRRLSEIDILTPRTAVLSPETSFDPKEWGDHVIVKPDNSNSGNGVRLVRTADLAARYDDLITLAHDERYPNARMLVQPFIDNAEDGYPIEYRVLTVFGRAIYAVRGGWATVRRPIEEIAADPMGVIATNSSEHMGSRVRAICNDAAVVSLGERTHQAFPECAVLGVDIVRDRESGQLYVLEVNPHGNVWLLSSTLAKTFDPQHIRDRYAQFNALDRVAGLLIEKTRTCAM
jgi:hypothetical protein